MPVQLIAGRAGSGKTTHCVMAVRGELHAQAVGGPRLIFLVPDQTTLQIERMVVGGLASRVHSRCDVLGFRRLARLILENAAGATSRMLSPLSRQMILRRILSNDVSRYPTLRGMQTRPGFLRALSNAIQELFEAHISQESLARLLEDKVAADAGGQLASDILGVFAEYQKHLGETQLDADGMLSAAAARLRTTEWLRGARVWVDGFATLSPAQSAFLVELAAVAEGMHIALLMDPNSAAVDPDSAPADALSIFSATEQTWRNLCGALHAAGIDIAPPARLGTPTPPRFADSADLATLERLLFHSPQRNAISEPPLVDNAAVRIVRAADSRAEVAAVVHDLDLRTRRVDSPLRYRDVAILCRSLDSYHDLLSAELQRRGIPHFVDHRRPICHHPLVRIVRSITALSSSDDFGRHLMDIVRTGLTPLGDDDADALDAVVRQHGLHTPESWREQWPMHSSGRNDHRSQSATHARIQLLQRLEPIWNVLSRDTQRTCRGWATHVYDVLERLSVGARLADWSLQTAAARGESPREHEQVWMDVVGLLDELVTVLGDEEMDARTFSETLEAGLGDLTSALVPPTLDQVLVSAVDRGRQPALKAVYLLGFADGRFPQDPEDGPLLGDSERLWLADRKITMSAYRRQRLLDERLLAYVAVTRSSQRLWISYAASDAHGRVVMPSPYLEHVRNALPHVPIETIEPAALASTLRDAGTVAELASAALSTLRRAATEPQEPLNLAQAVYNMGLDHPQLKPHVVKLSTALQPPPRVTLDEKIVSVLHVQRPIRVTSLDTLARCAFRYHATHGLRLRDDEPDEPAREWGNIVHAAMEWLLNRLASRELTFGTATPRMIDALVSRYVQRHLQQSLDPSETDPGHLATKQLQLRSELSGIISALRKWPVHPRPAACEQAFDHSGHGWPPLTIPSADGSQVLLHGKIDRIDLIDRPADSATPQDSRPLGIVLDYKRRSASLRLNLGYVFQGFDLQLPVYLLALEQFGRHLSPDGVTAVAAFFVPVWAGLQSIDHPDDATDSEFDRFKEFRPRGMLDYSHVTALDPALKEPGSRSDVFFVSRKKDGELGDVNRSDALHHVEFVALLDHVRQRVAALAAGQRAGNAAVEPHRVDNALPCNHCSFASVCRFEVGATTIITVPKMGRDEVLAQLRKSAPDVAPAANVLVH